MFCFVVLFWFLRQNLTVSPWLVWNALCRTGWPQTHRSVCLKGCSTTLVSTIRTGALGAVQGLRNTAWIDKGGQVHAGPVSRFLSVFLQLLWQRGLLVSVCAQLAEAAGDAHTTTWDGHTLVKFRNYVHVGYRKDGEDQEWKYCLKSSLKVAMLIKWSHGSPCCVTWLRNGTQSPAHAILCPPSCSCAPHQYGFHLASGKLEVSLVRTSRHFVKCLAWLESEAAGLEESVPCSLPGAYGGRGFWCGCLETGSHAVSCCQPCLS